MKYEVYLYVGADYRPLPVIRAVITASLTCIADARGAHTLCNADYDARLSNVQQSSKLTFFCKWLFKIRVKSGYCIFQQVFQHISRSRCQAWAGTKSYGANRSDSGRSFSFQHLISVIKWWLMPSVTSEKWKNGKNHQSHLTKALHLDQDCF